LCISYFVVNIKNIIIHVANPIYLSDVNDTIMPIYHKLGAFPSKRHTVFRQENGALYQEELFGTEGFSSMSSLLYHCHPPTMIKEIGTPVDVTPEAAIPNNKQPRSYRGFDITSEDDFLSSRKTLLFNSDVQLGLAAPKKSMSYFYKNAEADELVFIHKGSGRLKTAFGSICFEYGDYLVIPRGCVYQFEFDTEENRLLVIESFSPILTPRNYRNKFGQLLEHAPFCERDYKLPENLETNSALGDYTIYIKKHHQLTPYTYAAHPFDVVGWDGYNYPYGFSIHNFEPMTGRVHLPPPVHQTFEGHNFVVCSFVPRMYDYHPQAIPAPYNHSNIDSDEVLYYVDGDFMSRNNIEKGMITLHPGGLPHGPHPGALERSIGQKETQELAVMIDPFKPLQLTKEAMRIEQKDYYKSWL